MLGIQESSTFVDPGEKLGRNFSTALGKFKGILVFVLQVLGYQTPRYWFIATFWTRVGIPLQFGVDLIQVYEPI